MSAEAIRDIHAVENASSCTEQAICRGSAAVPRRVSPREWQAGDTWVTVSPWQGRFLLDFTVLGSSNQPVEIDAQVECSESNGK